MDQVRKIELVRTAVTLLARERSALGGWMPPAELSVGDGSFAESWRAFRALVNTRDALPAPAGFLEVQDGLLQGMIAEAGITQVEDLAPCPVDARIRLWRGDITTIAADAIVNAANSGMTGCWQPLHGCIDNAIHTYAGVQLRLECTRLMDRQGHPEPTGRAKVTDSYNLPCRRIVHTVGPIAQGTPTVCHRQQLAQCYRACIDAAAREGLSSIAFCCISTGVFGFPQSEAAAIAVKTVRSWLDGHPGINMTVVFDVFQASDERLYRSLLM